MSIDNRRCDFWSLLSDCSPIHLLFAMDTSLSLDNNTEKLVDYTSRSIERLLLKGAGFRIAFLSYDYESTEHLRLGQYQTVETIKEALQNISIESTISPTFTGKALKRGIQVYCYAVPSGIVFTKQYWLFNTLFDYSIHPKKYWKMYIMYWLINFTQVLLSIRFYLTATHTNSLFWCPMACQLIERMLLLRRNCSLCLHIISLSALESARELIIWNWSR